MAGGFSEVFKYTINGKEIAVKKIKVEDNLTDFVIKVRTLLY